MGLTHTNMDPAVLPSRVPLYEGPNEAPQSDGFVKDIDDLCGFVSPRVEQSPDLTAQRH